MGGGRVTLKTGTELTTELCVPQQSLVHCHTQELQTSMQRGGWTAEQVQTDPGDRPRAVSRGVGGWASVPVECGGHYRPPRSSPSSPKPAFGAGWPPSRGSPGVPLTNTSGSSPIVIATTFYKVSHLLLRWVLGDRR